MDINSVLFFSIDIDDCERWSGASLNWKCSIVCWLVDYIEKSFQEMRREKKRQAMVYT